MDIIVFNSVDDACNSCFSSSFDLNVTEFILSNCSILLFILSDLVLSKFSFKNTTIVTSFLIFLLIMYILIEK